MRFSLPDGYRFLRTHRRILLLALLPLLLALGLRDYLAGAKPPDYWLEKIEERIEAGKSPGLRSDIALATYHAARVNLILALLLMLTAPWWGRPLASPPSAATPGPPRKWALFAFLALVLLGTSSRIPLWTGGLEWDELWSVRRTIVGSYATDDNGEKVFQPTDWSRAFFYYPRPTNHMLTSVSAKALHGLWDTGVDREPHEFSAPLLRLPSLLAKVASFLLMGALLWRWRLEWVGVVALSLCIISPWAWRYGIALRGYSLVMMGTLWGLHLLTTLWKGRPTGWTWASLGISSFLLVYAFPYAIWAAAALFGSAIWAILHRWQTPRDRMTACARLAMVNVVAAMAFIQLFAPNLLQATRWLKDFNAAEKTELTPSLAGDFFANALAGLNWDWKQGPDAAGLTSFSLRWDDHPVLVLLWSLLALTCLVLGVRLLWGRARGLAIGVIFLLVSALASLISFAFRETFFFTRFLIHAAIPVFIVYGAGSIALGEILARRAGRKIWGALPPLALAGGMAWLCFPQIQAHLTREVAPLASISRHLDEGGERIAVGCGAGTEILSVYHPDLRMANTLDHLKEFEAMAIANNQLLTVVFGHRHINERAIPEIIQHLEESGQYEIEHAFTGIEPQHSFWVLRHRGEVGTTAPH